MNVFIADMHIHTCLSPCAEREMSPKNIVEEAICRGLNIIAICDHNSSENVAAAKKAAEGSGLSVVGGIEITTKEEVHMLGFFEENEMLAEVQKVIYKRLDGENDPDYFGEQLIVDESNYVIGENNRLLIGATSIPVKEVVEIIHNHQGIAVASHIDRPSFSLISQLGFVPHGLGLDCVEVFSEKIPVPNNLGVIFSSDAHRLGEIGRRRTKLMLESASFSEIRMALKGINGRKIKGTQLC